MFFRYWVVFFTSIYCCFWQGESCASLERVVRTKPPQYCVLDNGIKVYYSYFAALEDAIDHHKLGICVFFNPSYSGDWEELVKRDLCLTRNVSFVCNFVILQPGLINSMEFYPKMDPMIHYMAEFLEHFPDRNMNEPCIIFIAIDSKGQDYILYVLPHKFFV